MDATSVRDRVTSLVDADGDPTLDPAEVQQIIDASRIDDAAGNSWRNGASAGSWGAGTAVAPGAVIVVSGRYWRCIVGGTTGATAPSWPTLTGYPVNAERTVTDNGAVWADNGTAWSPTWDLDRAAMLGWELKAGKATARYNFTTDDQRFERAQVAAGCRDQADRYRRRLLSNVTSP